MVELFIIGTCKCTMTCMQNNNNESELNYFYTIN